MSERRLHTCMLCEAACGLTVTVARERGRRRVVEVRGDADDPMSRGFLCPKGAAIPDLMADPDRVRAPLRRQGDGWAPVSWDAALREAAERLAEVQDKHGRDAVGFYTGTPALRGHAGAVGAQLFAAALGSRSVYSAASFDRHPRMVASLEVFGNGLLLPVPDLDRTNLLVLLGTNPVVSNGCAFSAPGIGRRVRALRQRGGRLIVVDPLRSETAALADQHLAIRPGGDPYLLLAMMQVIFAEERSDPARLVALSNGLETLQALSARFPPERVAGVTGLAPDVIRGLARAFAAAPAAVCHAGSGALAGEHAALTAWLVTALHVTTGNLDRPGGAMFPAAALDLAALLQGPMARGPYGRWKSRGAERPEVGGALPAIALAEDVEAPAPHGLRALVTFAGNPVLSTPGGSRLDRALPRLDFMVSLDVYRNETTRHAHLILPTSFGFEKDHLDLAAQLFGVRDGARFAAAVVHRPRGVREDFAILLDLALRLRKEGGGVQGRGLGFRLRAARTLGSRRVLDVLLRRCPRRITLGGLQRAPHGIDLGPLEEAIPDRLLTPQRRLRVVPPVFQQGIERLEARLADRSAPTARVTAPERDLVLLERSQLRGLSSWLHNCRRLARGRRTCTLRMHPADAAARGLVSGSDVVVRSAHGELRVRVEVSSLTAPGVVSLPHGYGHDRHGVALSVARAVPGASAADLADPARVDPLSGSAARAGVAVSVTRARP